MTVVDSIGFGVMLKVSAKINSSNDTDSHASITSSGDSQPAALSSIYTLPFGAARYSQILRISQLDKETFHSINMSLIEFGFILSKPFKLVISPLDFIDKSPPMVVKFSRFNKLVRL